MILNGAYELKLQRAKAGIVIIIFSALSLGVSGGFLLGVVGGVLGLAKI